MSIEITDDDLKTVLSDVEVLFLVKQKLIEIKTANIDDAITAKFSALGIAGFEVKETISLSQTDVTGVAGTTVSVTALREPGDNPLDIDKVSSDETVATVAYNEGTKNFDITLVKPGGTAEITFSSHADPSVSAKLKVTVQ